MQEASKTEPTSEVIRPHYVRVADAVVITGLSRMTIYNLMNRGLIRSCSLKQRGKRRGARLISLAHLLQYLDSRSSGGEAFPDQQAA